MSNPEIFRSETRAWLEANCPVSMRKPYESEADVCWGGRNWVFKSEDQREWLEVESGNTLDSIAGVVRKLIQDRVDKSKKGRTIK